MNTGPKPIFREANIWRMIGLAIVLFSPMLPWSSRTIVTFDKGAAVLGFSMPEAVSAGVLYILLGVALAAWPLIKDWRNSKAKAQ